eukprot:302008_1
MLLLVILYVLNVSLSTAYKAIAVEGEYPLVLPQASSKQAVGYDSSTHTILILGGSSAQQAVAYHINDMTFEDLGSDFMSEAINGVQFYSQHTDINTNLWMINGPGSGLIKFDTHSRGMDVANTNIPTNVSPHACLASYQHYLFVVGGWNDGAMQHIVQIYDTINNQWITNTPLMQESRSVCGCIVNGNRLYVVAGLNTDTIEWINVADVHNMDKQEWQYVNGHLPTPLRGNTVVNHGDQIIVLGGRSDAGEFSTTIPVINVGSNSISIQGSLAYSEDEAGCIIVGKRVYIFGGFAESGGAVNGYQYIDLPDIVVSTGMSGGSVFLLTLFIILIVYCIGGYVFNGYKSKEWGNVKGNIPQYEYWKYVPVLTVTGCKISYEYVRGKAGVEQKEPLLKTDDEIFV